jgi:hypothetical protein
MDLFIDTMNNMCLVENPHSLPHIKFQPDVQLTDKNTASGEISTDMPIDNPPTSASCSVPNKLVEVVIHLLVNEVINTTKLMNETPSARRDTVSDGAPRKSEVHQAAMNLTGCAVLLWQMLNDKPNGSQ